MKTGLFFVTLAMLISACEPDERIVPLVGVYRTHILGLAGPFDIIVSTHRGDNVLLEAPLNGNTWAVIEVDVDNHLENIVDLDIVKQDIYFGATIHGDGFFSNNTLELEYCIKEGGNCQWYKLVATKR